MGIVRKKTNRTAKDEELFKILKLFLICLFSDRMFVFKHPIL